VPKRPVLQTLWIIPLLALVIPSFHSSTLTTASLDLTHSLVRYFQTIVILEAHDIPKVFIALFAGDPNVIRHEQGMVEDASQDASHLY